MRVRTTLACFTAAGVICVAMTVAGCAASVDRPSPTTNIPSVVPAKVTGMDSDRAQIGKPALHSGDVWVDLCVANC